MKRHLFLLAYTFLLCACTSVEDFGAYWDKGIVDPALNGSWKKMALPGEPIETTPGADQLVFKIAGTSLYEMYGINPLDSTLPPGAAEQRKKDNVRPFFTRTLRVGSDTFLMSRASESKSEGILERYQVKGDTLDIYYLENGRAVDLLEAKYPNAANTAKNRGEGRYVVIKTFDDEVYRILSEMTRDDAYWMLQCQYRKQQ
jgi:hypothetical protein